MDYQKYLRMENASIPPEIARTLQSPGNNTPVLFADKNRILTDASQHLETGYCRLADGAWLVSMYCFMPGMTADMVNWWFWWHPLEDARYQLWYPGEHFSIGYAEKDADYFRASEMPPFRPNTQRPEERIGTGKMPLTIEFVTPEEFGYSKDLMQQSGVAAVICGHVSALNGLIKTAEMSHICFQREDGLLMVNRFWLGQRMKNPILRKKLLTEASARGMAEHCCIEYRNFAQRIPMLYSEYQQEKASQYTG